MKIEATTERVLFFGTLKVTDLSDTRIETFLRSAARGLMLNLFPELEGKDIQIYYDLQNDQVHEVKTGRYDIKQTAILTSHISELVTFQMTYKITNLNTKL